MPAEVCNVWLLTRAAPKGSRFALASYASLVLGKK